METNASRMCEILVGLPEIKVPLRIGEVSALGLDELLFYRKGAWRQLQWSTCLVDVNKGKLLDLVEGRTADAPSAWLQKREAEPPRESWRQGTSLCGKAKLEPPLTSHTPLKCEVPGMACKRRAACRVRRTMG